jgi:DNA mismatch repair ATPase MutS
LCALANRARENPHDPFPEVVDQVPCFDAEGLGHPFLPEKRCVRNDVSLGGQHQLLIVSGSNMSGKSTFLRTIGINTVLALAGAPVRATRLRLSPLVVGATLRIEDSLREGRSRFYAEALRVRQLLALAAGPIPLLFLLDEIFQGTNSRDRRTGAEATLRRLLDRGAVGLVTTHDLSLTEIDDLLAPRAVNVHFADQVVDGVMSFDYRLRHGVVPAGNGMALLRALGIED